MVAYIDFFLGGDEKRLDVAATIQKRFPMCLIFGGDGSYMSPYHLHSDTLLSNLLGQVNIRQLNIDVKGITFYYYLWIFSRFPNYITTTCGLSHIVEVKIFQLLTRLYDCLLK